MKLFNDFTKLSTDGQIRTKDYKTARTICDRLALAALGLALLLYPIACRTL